MIIATHLPYRQTAVSYKASTPSIFLQDVYLSVYIFHGEMGEAGKSYVQKKGGQAIKPDPLQFWVEFRRSETCPLYCPAGYLPKPLEWLWQLVQSFLS